MAKTLVKKVIIKGEIIAETGIMVGGSNTALEIGGTDKQVVRNPINKMPYIPGSSLKGKMRSMLELNEGTVQLENNTYGPTHEPTHLAARLFGHINKNKDKKQQASRLIVRDGELTNSKQFENTELLYTEVKAENTIDRITSAANPRFFERVPKGAKFNLNMSLNIFNDEDETVLLNTVFRCLELVQDDYLGGGGSRGNGQISFKVTSAVSRDTDYYKGTKPETDILGQVPSKLK